jgi:hypothetical protein
MVGELSRCGGGKLNKFAVVVGDIWRCLPLRWGQHNPSKKYPDIAETKKGHRYRVAFELNKRKINLWTCLPFSIGLFDNKQPRRLNLLSLTF